MDTLSAAAAARRLGTTLPRVLRAIDRLGLDVERRGGGRVRLSDAQVEQLRLALGSVPTVDGLNRVETQVLAALARAPRGLASSRAVARRASVSPTTAARALRALEERSLICREQEWIPAGRAREVELVRANTASPEWSSLAAQLANVRLPAVGQSRSPKQLPARLRHLFWNADTKRLDPSVHGSYIAERLVSSHDLDGLAWGIGALTREDWRGAAHNRGLSAQEQALACNLARAAGE